MPDSRATRSGSQGSISSLSLEDVKNLISQSEERIITKLESICSSITLLQSKFDDIRAEQIEQGLQINAIKHTILKQQEQIEGLEAHKRRKNLIFSGVPESAVTIEDSILRDDIQKLNHLCEKISEGFEEEDIVSCKRIGERKNGQIRLLHVKFNDVDTRNRTLFSQRSLWSDDTVSKYFGQIFVNKDSTILIRREEKRLRDRMKELRSASNFHDKIYIRSGKLFKNSTVVDEIKIANQLF